MKKNDITILGAGLIGSLMAIYLRRQGLEVSMYDKRPDKRKNPYSEAGRSINMALSHRGWKSLEQVGLKDKVMPFAIPMYGRRVHDEHGGTTFVPYGKADQAIYSISRGNFNQLLVEEAERLGTEINFDHKCLDVNFRTNEICFESPEGDKKLIPNVIIGADGAYSALRMSMQKQIRFNYRQEYISHGYKELTIPATASGDFAMDPNALHIWPRGKFMLIALPNPDKSFTCTLFLPFEGTKVCFEKIQDEKDLETVFRAYFDDAYQVMPNLKTEFFKNPTAALVNIECYPWVQGNSLLLGDASHAMVPFYGQGMNCGFEDCSILNGLIEKLGTNAWDLVFEKFQKKRKPDTDAICQLAMENFIEMRDSVSSPKFLLRKKIEAKLHELYPKEWIPLYTMVTFTDMSYAEAYAQGKLQEAIMNKVMASPLITENWDKLDYEDIINQMETAKAV
ncbi:MAG: NAD(P)/FAD-dependent oxidoreductase [Algoriphagus sp.]|uniref:FAD-dependent oxidoreductase n=1 Tax=Algoriphagus sp. TaxID=1872435 RepID=UPI0027300C82|nr:NAD(P)/FAD-dependent oxidoreductase [Algoriphagus sp.]MDP2040406.1 NAD(P)/FAD-dependent oxidoreductase [Algoriphagus sp.]MDP3470667.1 NAD(P)/FAD-dependent oxidoreductase [Algoriphagus sp.]